MSVLNGKVEAPNHKIFKTHAEAVEFMDTLRPEQVEGIQVRSYGFIVNYFD